MLLDPDQGLRDEGASYHYVKAFRYIEVTSRALTGYRTVLKGKEILYQDIMIWSAFIETPDKVAYRIEGGAVSCGDGVCLTCRSPSFVMQFGACSRLLHDSLADLENYDQRDWGAGSFEKAL